MNNTKTTAHLESLKQAHKVLNDEVDQLNKSHIPEDIARAGALKQKKLQVKNEIRRLESNLGHNG
jgi:hypothetical protein